MSEETKTVLLKVELDQQAAIKNLQETEKNILSLKAQQKELNDELKKGKITQDEYVQSKIKLDTQLKQEAQSRSTLQKAVIAENNSLGAQKALLADLINQRERVDRSTKEGADKFEHLTGRIKSLNDSLMQTKKESGGFGEAFLKFAENAKVGEFELEKITKLMPLISSPALAAGAAITALGAAYANSAAGGKDLEEAQNILKAQWELFSGSIGGDVKEEGGGLISKIVKNVLGISKGFSAAAIDFVTFTNTLGLAGTNLTKKAEENEKQVEKLTHLYNKLTEIQFEQLENEVKASKQRKESYELTVKRSDAELTIEQRIEAAHKVVELQRQSVEGSTEALKKQAQTLIEIGKLTNNNVLDEKNISALRKQYLQLLVQIQEVETSRERKISAAEIAERNLTNELKKQKELEAFEAAKTNFVDKNKPKEDFDLEKQKLFAQSRANIKKFENDLKLNEDKKYNKNYADILKERAEREREKEKEHEELVRKQTKTDRAYLTAQKQFTQLAKGILGERSDEYKVFATAQAIMSTFLAADNVLADPDLIYPANIIASLGIVAEGIANVSEINKAAGGGSFMTKGPTMLLVGDNPGGQERVDVTPISGKGETKINPSSGMLQLAGGGSVYAQGGLVTGEMSQSVNQEIALQNAFKNMPQPIVSWKEGLIVGARIQVKEKLTTR